MVYDYVADIERRRKIARMMWPSESPSPPPEDRKKAEQTRPPAFNKRTTTKAFASSNTRSREPVKSVQVVDMSSPESEPTPLSPTGLNPLKRARGDTSEATMSDVASPPQIPFADGERKPPGWYIQIKDTSFGMKQVNQIKGNSPILTKLDTLKDAIKACQEAHSKANMTKPFNRLRYLLHDADFVEVDKFMLKKKLMLGNKTGLARIFDPEYSGGVDYTWDIKADAKQLYNRWWMEVFSIDLLRGINRAYHKNKDGQRNSDTIDKDFKRLYANYYGQGTLVNGQWWPTQLCTLRDGAHGSAQGGIYGEKDKGVYSIVLSGGHHYGDEDHGDEIWYCGTDGKDESVTRNTQFMMDSCDAPMIEKEPVRVIRSSNLKRENPFRPGKGFRYDGLYDIVESQPIDKSMGIYKFRLVRRPGQDPIRWQGVEIRPTEQELAAYQKLLDGGKLPT